MMDPDGDRFDFPVERDRETGAYRTRIAWNGERPPSVAIVGLLEAATGVDPVEAEPLWNYVDPDALDGLFAPTKDGHRSGGRVSFRYAGFEVVVNDDGEVTLTPVDGSG